MEVEPVFIKSMLFRILDNKQSPEAKNFLIGLSVCVATGTIWYAFDYITAWILIFMAFWCSAGFACQKHKFLGQKINNFW